MESIGFTNSCNSLAPQTTEQSMFACSRVSLLGGSGSGDEGGEERVGMLGDRGL